MRKTSFVLVGVCIAKMDLANLTRQHGFKIIPTCPCSVEECSLSVREILGHSSIKSAARMNSAVVIFVDSVEKTKWLRRVLSWMRFFFGLSSKHTNEKSHDCKYSSIYQWWMTGERKMILWLENCHRQQIPAVKARCLTEATGSHDSK